MKESEEDDIINGANKTGLFDMSLGLSDKEQRERMAKTGHIDSAITFGDAKVESRASITMVHAEREGEVTSVALAKTMAKSVFSIAANVTSGSEEEETDNNKVMDGALGVEINGMEMVDKEIQSLTNNMNRATVTLQLGSSESASKEGSQGNATNDSNKLSYHTESKNSSYHTEDDSYDTPHEHDIDSEDYNEALEVSSGELNVVHANKFQAPDNFRQQLWNEGPTVDSMMVQLTMIRQQGRNTLQMDGC